MPRVYFEEFSSEPDYDNGVSRRESSREFSATFSAKGVKNLVL